VGYHRYMLQDLDEVLVAELGRSTGAVGQAGQPDRLRYHNLSFIVSIK